MAVAQSRFTRDELSDLVKGELGLRSSNLVTSADLVSWGGEASDIIARSTKWYKATSLPDSVSGTQEYDLPTDCIAIEEVLWSASGTANTHDPLGSITLADLYAGDPAWREASSGTPMWYYVRGATSYGLYPKPDATVTDGIKVVYAALPPLPASGAGTYSVPYGNGQAIKSYCKWRASEKDSSGEGGRRVDWYHKQWVADLKALVDSIVELAEAEVTVIGTDGGYRRYGDWFSANDVIDAAP